MSEQVTTLTFFNYPTFRSKLWAFGMMQFAHKPMSKVPGLRFYKLMGSGKGAGFNPWPDWSVYAILQVWDNRESAESYFENSLHQRYKDRAKHIWTLFMKVKAVKGSWSGTNPFQENEADSSYPLAVITRATIKTRELYHFWKYVPASQKGLFTNDGLMFTKGIGEVPLVQMATFSIWENEDKLKNFAYRGKEHNKAIQLTRSRDWYSEEMFARFAIVKSIGSWQGMDEQAMERLIKQIAA